MFVVKVCFACFEGAHGVIRNSNLTLDNAELNVTLREPVKKLPFDTVRLLVKGLSEKTTRDGLLSYLEVVSGLEVSDIEFGVHGSTLVTFSKEYGKLRQ